MAVDKLVDSTQLDADLTSVANAIRTKGGTSDDLAFPAGFVSAVQAIPTGGNANWMGNNPALIRTEILDAVYLKDTDYSDWTPSTTAGTIKSPEFAFSFQADTGTKEYLIHTQFAVYLSYESGAPTRAMFLEGNGEYWHGVARYASNLANLQAETRNSNVMALVNSSLVSYYYAVSGAESSVFSMSYGVYPAVQNPVFSSSTSLTPTITINTPQVSARCHDSYLSPANAALVDEDASYYRVKFEVWSVDAGTSLLRNIQDARMDVFNHGLS